MSKRLIGGIIVVAAWAVALIMRMVLPVIFDAMMLFITLVAAWELCNAIKERHTPPQPAYVFIAIFLAFAGQHFWGLSAYFAGVAIGALLLALSMLWDKSVIRGTLVSSFFIMIYPVCLFGFMLQLNTISPNLHMGMLALLLVIAVSSLTDVMAYLVGVNFGKHKLCPNISPKKSVEGAVGGLLGGVIGAMLVLLACYLGAFGLTLLPVSTATNIICFIIIGIVGSVLNQAGDLAASAVKRSCGIKDYGKIIVGHGGIMDRLDGVIFVAVFIYSFLMIFNQFVQFL